MKNITLRAEESLIAAANARAAAENTTLNEQFQHWLADYARAAQPLRRYSLVMQGLRGELEVGARLDRDATNER